MGVEWELAIPGASEVKGGELGLKLASQAWTAGKAGSRMANLLYHFTAHGKALGYRNAVSYTLGGLVRATPRNYVRSNNAVRGIVRKIYQRSSRVIIKQGKRLVTYY